MINKKAIGYLGTFFLMTLLLVSVYLFGNKKESSVNPAKLYLNVFYKESRPGDTLTLKSGNALSILLGKPEVSRIKATINSKGYFKFEVPITEKFGYFTLEKPRTYSDLGDGAAMALINPQFWEQGDSLTLYLSHKETMVGIYAQCTFSGNGALKYNIREAVNHFDIEKYKREHEVKNEGLPYGFNGNILKDKGFDEVSDYDRAKLDIVEKNRNAISPLSYELLKAEILYKYKEGALYRIKQFYMDSLHHSNPVSQEKFKSRYEQLYSYEKEYLLSNNSLRHSLEYLKFRYRKVREASFMYTGDISMDWCFNEIKNNTEGLLRENLLMMLFLRLERNSENTSELYSEAEGLIQTTKNKQVLQEIMVHSAGKKFSLFPLQDNEGKTFYPQELQGKVVLIDFWFTGCGYCRNFYKQVLSKVKPEFEDNPDVTFLSISTDRNKEKWIGSIKSGLYTSLDAINLYTNGKGTSHPIIRENLIQGYPTIILLDRNGNIKFFDSNNLYQPKELTKAIHELL